MNMQKIFQHVPDIIKVHLLGWQQMEASDGNIVVVFMNSSSDDPHHHRLAQYHHPLGCGGMKGLGSTKR